MPLWKHIGAVTALPFTVTVVVPIAVLYGGGRVPGPDGFPFPLLAMVYLIVGAWLVGSTVRHFGREGHGTLAPWSPPRQLVVTGVYRYVRNPMISGVLFILLAEATFFGERSLLIWFLIFFAANIVYIPLFEERGLEKRFGDAYLTYKANVPRWIPRAKPWEPPVDWT